MVEGKSKSGLGAGAYSYMNQVIAEMLTGESIEMRKSEAMQHGIDTEEQAIYEYEKRNFIEVEKVGFISYIKSSSPIMRKYVGASPDGLVGTDGLIEVKCFNTENTVAFLLNPEVDKQYYAQMQGQMMVTNRKWVDHIIFDPRIKREELQMKVVRVDRNEEYISKLKERLIVFCTELDEKLEQLNLYYRSAI